MGSINSHGEAVIRGTHNFYAKGNVETVKKAFGKDLETGGGRERDKGGGDPGFKDMY